jgi:hypothetical protein
MCFTHKNTKVNFENTHTLVAKHTDPGTNNQIDLPNKTWVYDIEYDEVSMDNIELNVAQYRVFRA